METKNNKDLYYIVYNPDTFRVVDNVPLRLFKPSKINGLNYVGIWKVGNGRLLSKLNKVNGTSHRFVSIIRSRKGIHYNVHSPDNYSIERFGSYSSKTEAIQVAKNWVKEFEKSGFFHSHHGPIPVDQLLGRCKLLTYKDLIVIKKELI